MIPLADVAATGPMPSLPKKLQASAGFALIKKLAMSNLLPLAWNVADDGIVGRIGIFSVGFAQKPCGLDECDRDFLGPPSGFIGGCNQFFQSVACSSARFFEALSGSFGFRPWKGHRLPSIDWLSRMNAVPRKWMHHEHDLAADAPISLSDDRSQQKRRALQWTLGEDSQHRRALYAGRGARAAVMIDDRHDLPKNIIAYLRDRPGVNRKYEFVGL
ncbi:UNVERIFIED_ORG: hypothetical protein GGE53_000889 [Rhizobium etli]